MLLNTTVEFRNILVLNLEALMTGSCMISCSNSINLSNPLFKSFKPVVMTTSFEQQCWASCHSGMLVYQFCFWRRISNYLPENFKVRFWRNIINQCFPNCGSRAHQWFVIQFFGRVIVTDWADLGYAYQGISKLLLGGALLPNHYYSNTPWHFKKRQWEPLQHIKRMPSNSKPVLLKLF